MLEHVTAVAGFVLAILLSTGSASAQTVLQDRLPGALPDGRITAFIAYAPQFTRSETRRVFVNDELQRGDFDIRHGPGYGAGAALEIRAFDVVRLGTAFTYLRRGSPMGDANADTVGMPPGADVLLSRASLTMRFQEGRDALQRSRLGAALHAGPAYVLEIPRSVGGDEAIMRAMGSWGVAAGFDAEATLSPRVTLLAGVEDYAVFWNDEELGRRVDEGFASRGLDTSTRVTARASHAWLVRLGVAFIFR